MMTSSNETLGQNRAQLAAGVQVRRHAVMAASPAAACCELVLCPRRAGPARADLGRAGRNHVRDGQPRGRGAHPRVRDGQP